MIPLVPPPRDLVRHGGGIPLRPEIRLAFTGTIDRHAERVLRSALAELGLHRAGGPGADLTFHFAPGASPGYRIAVAGNTVRIEGDGAGQFHAAHVLRQLMGRELPVVTVTDHPAMPWRGTIEGFYGTPWTHRERLWHLDFLGAHRMNTYVYAPKDDPYHRECWREPYPDEKLAELRELIERAAANHVRLVFTVSPGLSIRYSEPADLAALLAKFQTVRALGCTDFCVALDDIDHGVWHDPRDEDRFGTPGAAHAWLVGEVREWAGTPVQLVPTEYHGLADTPYKQDLRAGLPADTLVWWTGRDVVPAMITRTEAQIARAQFGRPLLVWDNYPVNDYIPGRVPLGPYDGREPGLSAHVDGVLSNPANQVAMSTVALRAVAEYGWDDTGFDPVEAHRRSLTALAHGDPATLLAFATFADLNTRDNRLHLEQAPAHRAALDVIRTDLANGDRVAALARLSELATRLVTAPALINRADPRFAVEAEAWLVATRLWGEALAALSPIVEHGATTGRESARVRALARAATAVRDDRRPHRTVGALVGDGVLDEFVTELLR